MSRRGKAALGTVLFLVLAALFVRSLREAPDAARRLLALADRPSLALGLVVYALAYVCRAVRLNLLLPEGQRLPFVRAFSLSGATTFLLQILPFRTGEAAGWAAVKREMGISWSRAGAIFAMVKVVDTATMLLTGLAGAAVLAFRRGQLTLSAGTAALVLATAAGLLLLPILGAGVLGALSTRLGPGSRLSTILDETSLALRVARESPALYAGAVAGAFGFMAGHLAGLTLLMNGVGTPVSLAGLAFASLLSVLSAAIPSPAGTFGPMETGFAAGLALDGVAVGRGVLAAAVIHLLTTAVCGLIGLPALLRVDGRRPSPPRGPF